MIKKNLTSSIILVMMLLITPCVSAQTYRQIKGWSKEVNDRLEDFLNSTITMKIRKVAVFDGDGTVMGQVPHYLADEALYQYADEHFKGKTDKFSKEKMAILNRMVKDGNNVGKPYVEDRVHFLAGLTPEEILEMGYACYQTSYRNKFYPEMKQLIANLKEYGFEVWILTASPEFLYQKFLAEELGIPEVNILGVKSVVVGGKLTDDIILPIPQDDGKANVIPTFIKTRPLVVGGNSRGDMDIAAIPGTIFCGWLSDKVFKGRRAITTMIYMVAVAIFVFVYWEFSKTPLMDSICLIAIGFLIYGPVMLIGVHALDLAPKKAAGTAAGFTGFFGYFFGTALFANIGLGYVVQNLGWNWNFIVLLVACALAFIFIGFTAKEEQYLVKQAKQ